MAIPDKDRVLSMSFGWGGVPMVHVPAKESVLTQSLDYGWEGVPFVTPLSGLSPPVGRSGDVVAFIVT